MREIEAPRIHFLNGKILNSRTRMEMRDEDRRAIRRAQCEDAQYIQDYINGLSPRGFTNLLPNMRAARSAVCNLTAKSPRFTKLLRDYQQTLLNEIEEQPQPFVQPSRAGRTVRLIPVNRGISLLEKSVRRRLAPLWSEWDLRAAQFAICAKLWGVESVQAFLKDRNRNIWIELADYLGLDVTRTKQALKNAGVYPLFFGMPDSNVAAGVTRALAGLGYVLQGERGMSYGKRFLKHPLIADMLMARDQALKEIKAAGGALNCYGDWIAYDPTQENENSVLAQLAQAVEMQLLVPVFRLAQASEGELTIMLYQFDGVSVTTRRSDRREYWLNEAQAAVDEQAQRLGVETTLAGTF